MRTAAGARCRVRDGRRLDAVKNHGLMLRALARLQDGSLPVGLLIVGDGAERPRLEALLHAARHRVTVDLTRFPR